MTQDPNDAPKMHCRQCTTTFTVGQPAYNLDGDHRRIPFRNQKCGECGLKFMDAKQDNRRIRVFVNIDHPNLIDGPSYPLISRGSQSK